MLKIDGGCVLRLAAMLAILTPTVTAAQDCPGPRDPRSRPKIVGGWPTKLSHWPGQVALRLHNADRGESAYFCGGTLIHPRWVLTAAHCFQRDNGGTSEPFFTKSGQGQITTLMEADYWRLNQDPMNFEGDAELQAVVGTHNLRKVKPNNVRMAKRIIVHPKYRDATQSGHDIALVELAQPWVGPLMRVSTMMRTDPETPPGALAMVAGFGSQQWGAPLKLYKNETGQRIGAGSDSLREVGLPTVSQSACAQRYGRSEIGPGQICAGHEQGGKDSCQGDSGGPLVVFDRKGCPYQVGIVSWGEGCALSKAYGVYTRVSAHAKWIRSHVPRIMPVPYREAVTKDNRFARWKEANNHIQELGRVLGPPRGQVRLRIIQKESSGVVSADAIQLGKKFVFEVASQITGFLILVDINADGQITQIFPNKYVTDRRIGWIRKGQTIRVPDPSYGFDHFRASEPIGEGKLLVLVAPDGFASEYKAVAEIWRTKGFTPERERVSFFANLINQLNGLIRGNRQSANQSEPEWDHAVVPYEIVR